jgi:hypothetical protein
VCGADVASIGVRCVLKVRRVSVQWGVFVAERTRSSSTIMQRHVLRSRGKQLGRGSRRHPDQAPVHGSSHFRFTCHQRSPDQTS